MKVVVDNDVCESNAICMGIAPEVFEVRDGQIVSLEIYFDSAPFPK